MDRMLVRSEDTRCHRGFRPLAMSEKMSCVAQCTFQYAAGQATIYLRSYIIIDMYISIYSATDEVYDARENAFYQQFFASQEMQLRTKLLDDLWGGRFLPVSCRAAPVIRHPPQRGPSLPPQRPLGRTPNGRRPSRAQAVSPVFLHCVSCRPPLRSAPFRFAPKGGRSPSACTCYPCPRRRVAQGLLVNNNRQYQKAERTTR
jgi:hypothetical protein